MNYTKLLLSVVALSQVSLSAFPALKDKEITYKTPEPLNPPTYI